MRLTGFEAIDHLITDAEIEGELKETLKELNVEIINV